MLGQCIQVPDDHPRRLVVSLYPWCVHPFEPHNSVKTIPHFLLQGAKKRELRHYLSKLSCIDFILDMNMQLTCGVSRKGNIIKKNHRTALIQNGIWSKGVELPASGN
jgi:hypothetical protein